MSGENGRELAEEIDVDEWHPDFDRVTHSGPVGVAQQLVAHVPVHLQSRYLQSLIADAIQAFVETRAIKTAYGEHARRVLFAQARLL